MRVFVVDSRGAAFESVILLVDLLLFRFHREYETIPPISANTGKTNPCFR